MDQTLCLLFMTDSLEIQSFLDIFKSFYLVIFVISDFVNAVHADNFFIGVAVEVQEMSVVSTDRLVAEESQQMLDIFFGLLDIFQREDIVLIEL